MGLAPSQSGVRGVSSAFNWAEGAFDDRVTMLLNEKDDGAYSRYYRSPDKTQKSFIKLRYKTDHKYNVDFRGIVRTEELPTDAPVLETGATARTLDYRRFEATLLPCILYGRSTFSIPELVLNEGDDAGMLDIVDEEARNMAEVLVRVMDRAFWHPGDGSLGEVHAAQTSGNATLRLKRDDQISWRNAGYHGAAYVRVNQTFRIFDPQTGTWVGSDAYICTGQTFDPGTGSGGDNGYDTVSFEGNLDANVAAGCLLFAADINSHSREKWPWSFLQMYDDGTVSPSFMGLPRVDEPRLGLLQELNFTTTTAEGTSPHYHYVTHPELHRLLSTYYATHRKRVKECVGNQAVLDQLVWQGLLIDSADRTSFPDGNVDNESAFMSNQRNGLARGATTFQGGYERFTFAHPQYGKDVLKWVADEDAPTSSLMFHDPANLLVWEREPWHRVSGFLTRPRDGYYTDPDQDVGQIRYRWMGNWTTRNPQECAWIRRIRNQRDANRFD